LTGCATSQISPPPDWAGTNEVAALPKLFAAITNSLPSAKTNFAPVVHTNILVTTNFFKITNAPPRAPIATWTSLANWANEHKLARQKKMSNSPLVTYSLSSSNGVLVFAIGSREAMWNGIEIHLGFAPEIIDGEVFVHGLDLQKNLEPLLCAPPLDFSATNRIIVIDPGHGGINGGTVSVIDKRPEKEFTLDWARRLKPLLEANGWKVFLTRTNDSEVLLFQRVSFAIAHHANFFTSLHFNSSAPDKKQSGLETYCLTPTGEPSTLTRGDADMWTENLPNNFFDAQNLQFAVRLHAAILRATSEEDRGVRRARFMGVLRGQKCPAVLIEGGYLSNPHEAEKIENPDYRQKLAEAIANALK
jgi:N-acetylmuramoyl-L-alanine amidase